VHVSEQNLDWPLANRMVSNNAHSANHFRLAQAGVMNINERKRSSASPGAGQAVADSHFVHS